MGKTIRFGFWGTGAVARDVAQDFSLVSDAAVSAVASRTRANAEAFAARFNVPQVYDRLEALLGDPDVDVVYVATPHHRHLEDTLRCIDAGKAVLCEKPFTLNAAEAERVVAAARTRQVFVMEAMWMRFIPAIVETKRRVQAGELGAIRMIQANFAYPTYYDPNGRFFSRELGGGALLDRGVYPISFACHLLGVPEGVTGVANLGPSGVDEQSAYQLTYSSGALADLSASLRVLGTNEAVIMGELGQIRLHAPFYRAHRLSAQSFALPQPESNGDAGPQGVKGKVKAVLKQSATVHALRRRLDTLRGAIDAMGAQSLVFPGNGYQFEIAEVVRCLQQGRTESTIMPLDDTLVVMRVMDRLRGQWGLAYPQEA